MNNYSTENELLNQQLDLLQSLVDNLKKEIDKLDIIVEIWRQFLSSEKGFSENDL